MARAKTATMPTVQEVFSDDTDLLEIQNDSVQTVANEPEETSPEIVKIFGAPYLIRCHLASNSNQFNDLPMMHLNPAIDAAREISKDGSYITVAVISNYNRNTYAVFYRWIGENDGKLHTEGIEPISKEESDG